MEGEAALRVGYQRKGYPEIRNIVGSRSGARYVLVPDGNRVRAKACRGAKRIFRLRCDPTDLDFTFRGIGFPPVDLVHFFNAISFGSRPWLSTFETILPRFRQALTCHHGETPDFSVLARDPQVLRALEALAGDPCRRLIALSRCNLEMQHALLRHFPEHQDAIARKLVHLAPPQMPLIGALEEKGLRWDGELRFVFVGSSFFTKGGPEVLRTLARLRRDGHPVRLTIVSALSPTSHARIVSREDVDAILREIRNGADWIEHFRALPNPAVLDLMRRSHIGLLPSFAETYGFAVLEFQAAGCPVVTTDVRALPEINNEETGWLISVPKNRFGEALFTSREDQQKLARSIEVGLARILEEILLQPEVAAVKGQRSLERVRRDHSPEVHGARLREIYRDALG